MRRCFRLGSRSFGKSIVPLPPFTSSPLTSLPPSSHSEKEKVSKKEFYDRCREAQTTDVKASHYLNIMLSSVDFPQFVALMRTMRRLHGDRLDRQDRNAEGAVQLDDMLAGSKKKKKKEKKTVGTGDDSKGVESDDEGLDSKGERVRYFASRHNIPTPPAIASIRCSDFESRFKGCRRQLCRRQGRKIIYTHFMTN